MRSLRLLVAVALALGAVTASPSAAFAECRPVRVTDDIRDYIGAAFTAEVVEVTDETGPPTMDAAVFDWMVVLDVDKVYRGRVDDTLTWKGWNLGCSGIRPGAFKEGQRLFVSADKLDAEGIRAPGHFTLIWKKGSNGWRFFRDALKYGYDGGWYPAEAEGVSSLREIRKMVGALHRPYDEPTAPWPESTVAVPRDDLIDVLVHDWDHIDVSDDGRTLDIYYRAGVPECWALDSVKVATAEWGHRVEVHMGRIPGGTDCTEDEHPWVTTVELDESLDERWESATSDD